MARPRIIHAEGDAYARGRAVGIAAGDEIDRCLAFHRERLAALGAPTAALEGLLSPFLAASRAAVPDLVAQLEGMAAGAGADLWELLALNALEELEPLLEGSPAAPERCSTLTVSSADSTLLGHNEQWYSGDAGSAVVVLERPTDGRTACASPTVACYLPAVGMNAHGAAQGIDSLVADDDRVGVPRVLVSRHSLDARDTADAVRRATLPGRAGGYGHVLAFRSGEALAIETTATGSAIVDGPGPHANHYLDPELARVAPPPSEGSAGRYARLRELVTASPPQTAGDVMTILADHAAKPDAICLHPRRADDPEASAVLFSMVCDVRAGRMWVAAGNPCTTPYEEVDLSDVR